MPEQQLERSLSFAEIETELVEALEAAEEAGNDEALVPVVQAYLDAASAKRDRVAAFLTHLESQTDACAKEIKRLQERKATITHAQERLERYIVATMENLGVRKL